jgi:hypothetical protein
MLQPEFSGITAEGAFELFDGWVTTKFAVPLVEKRVFDPVALPFIL